MKAENDRRNYERIYQMYLSDELHSVILQSHTADREVSGEVRDASCKGLGVMIDNVDRNLFKINDEVNISLKNKEIKLTGIIRHMQESRTIAVRTHLGIEFKLPEDYERYLDQLQK